MRPDFEKSSFLPQADRLRSHLDTNIHRTRFGFNRFRVLTVTTSIERGEASG